MARNRVLHALNTGYTEEGLVNGVESVLYWDGSYPKYILEQVLSQFSTHIVYIEYMEDLNDIYKQIHKDLKQCIKEHSDRCCSPSYRYRNILQRYDTGWNGVIYSVLTGKRITFCSKLFDRDEPFRVTKHKVVLKFVS
jgi:hypothetical protein